MTKPSNADVPLTHAEDLLARAYLHNLAEAEGVQMRSLLPRQDIADPMADILAELDVDDEDRPRLRADLATVAVLLARAVAGQPGLLKRLRRESPVVAIQTHTSDFVDLVEEAFKKCAVGGGRRNIYVEARDGTRATDKPDRGNAEIVDRINRKHLVCGIAPDPKKHLPSALLRTAEFRLSIPPLDLSTLRLVLEAVTGSEYQGDIDPDLVRVADLGDLLLAVRSGFTPRQCLDNLRKLIDSKNEFTGDGPLLEELDGYGQAKVWGLELAKDISDYRHGRLSWTEIAGKGLLLSGPPGTGKTQFASALAKTCGVPLIATSVAQWNAAVHLGETLKQIRDVFGRARRSAPCILFIDELDGISSRQRLSGDHVEYWAQIVNLVLELVAGVEDREGVVIVGATNHPEMIDPALRRSGRLDLEITIEMPDSGTLAKIFRHHLGPNVLNGVDLMPAALASRGRTGADVEAAVRRAKAAARRAERDLTIDELLDQIRGDRPKMSAATRHRAAIHEAGHALAGCLLESKVLLGVSLHDAGGTTEFELRFGGATTAKVIEDEIVIAMAGRAAEELVFGDISIGSGANIASDLAKGTTMALMLEASCGFGSFGNVFLGTKDTTDLTRHPWLIAPCQERMDKAAKRARELLSAHVLVLKSISAELEKAGYLPSDQVKAIVARRSEKPIETAPNRTEPRPRRAAAQ